MVGLMVEMRHDLSRSTTSWTGLESIPPEGDPHLTHLRALDILAWWHGNPRTTSDPSTTTG